MVARRSPACCPHNEGVCEKETLIFASGENGWMIGKFRESTDGVSRGARGGKGTEGGWWGANEISSRHKGTRLEGGHSAKGMS